MIRVYHGLRVFGKKGTSGGNSNPRRLCAVALGRNAVGSRWLRAAPPTCASNACVCRCVGAYYNCIKNLYKQFINNYNC